MNRKPKPEMIDAENPERTEEDFATAVPFSELPDSLRTVLASRRRGPQKAPTKQQVSLRLSADVIAYFKEGGSGWETRLARVRNDSRHERRAGSRRAQICRPDGQGAAPAGWPVGRTTHVSPAIAPQARLAARRRVGGGRGAFDGRAGHA